MESRGAGQPRGPSLRAAGRTCGEWSPREARERLGAPPLCRPGHVCTLCLACAQIPVSPKEGKSSAWTILFVPLVSGRGAVLISRDGGSLPQHQPGASLGGQHLSPLAPILCMPLSVFATALGGSFPLEAPVWLLLLLDKRPHPSASWGDAVRRPHTPSASLLLPRSRFSHTELPLAPGAHGPPSL